MARAHSNRRPAPAKRPLEPRPLPPTALRLAVAKGGLALEIGEPVAFGPLLVDELSVALVGLQFPVDLSGGVHRFRHRRGALERLSVVAQRERTTDALAPRLRGVLGAKTPSLTLAAIAGGAMVGMVSEDRALAFELLWAPSEEHARWLIARPRGIGLGQPSLAAALHASDAILGAIAERSGAVATISRASYRIARELLPALGARAPSTSDIRWGSLESSTQGWRVACDRSFSPALLPRHVISELELAELTRSADDALVSGRLDDARDGYATLLERSPRDPELARRIAEIDRCVPGREEAALATLFDAMPTAQAGVLGGELLAGAGKVDEAVTAFEDAARNEAFGPLAALALERASGLARGARDARRLLDEAVARAPALAVPRWKRLEQRLRIADTEGALADAEHIEAATRGSHARHEVWRRAGSMFLERGDARGAITLFERALRYVPTEPRAIAGLARSLLEAGRPARAMDLFARAIEAAEARDVPAYDVTLAYARALADSMGDLPHAVARVRAIPADQPESVEARGLEARWRAALGDEAGASQAFAAMRETIDLGARQEPTAVRWLLEAAAFERGHGAVLAAQRHLALALDLAPTDPRVVGLFREVSRQIASSSQGSAQPREPTQAVELPPPHVTLEASPFASRPGALEVPPFAPGHGALEDDASSIAAEDEARARVLEDKVRADPTDDATIIELCDLLMRLGRDLDLFALLSARLEEASEATRARLLPLHRDVLLRLSTQAEAEGRHEEAELYANALASLGAAANDSREPT